MTEPPKILVDILLGSRVLAARAWRLYEVKPMVFLIRPNVSDVVIEMSLLLI